MAFRWWRGGFPKFPFTNNHEANLDYFLSVFSEIWEEWETMYNDLKTWKENTDLSLEEWKNGVIDSIANWELEFQRVINEWKAETETDISEWENDVLEDLASWKQDFIDDYENIESRVESIVSDTEEMVENLAEPFSSDTSYLAGDYVVYNGMLYVFTANHTGAWSDNDTQKVTAMNEISDIKKSVLDEYSYDFSDVEPMNYIILPSGNWNVVSSGSSRSNVIEIPDGCTAIKITALSYDGYYSIFDSYTAPEIGATPDYSNGYSGRVSITAGSIVNIIKNEDFKYLYITRVDSSGNDNTPVVTFVSAKTDKTLTYSDIPADAKAVGDGFDIIARNVQNLFDNRQSIFPVFSGSYFGWEFKKYLTSSGTFSTPARSGTTIPFPVKPGNIIINNSSPTGDNGADTFTYLGLFNGSEFVDRIDIRNTGDMYMIPEGVDNIIFTFGTSSSGGSAHLDAEQVEKYFSVYIITEQTQRNSFIDTEQPVYIAMGASTTWGSVRHLTDPIYETKYQYPYIVGNKMNMKTINMAVGGSGMIARINSQPSGNNEYNIPAFNNGDNNYMDVLYYNDDIFKNASLVTISLAWGNDYSAGLPIGEFDDYYPYDETGYHPSGSAGITTMINKGATYFGCLNWFIKWFSEHYPKAILIILYYRPSLNQPRTITKINNTNPEGVGNPKYKLEFTDPYTGNAGAKLLNDGLKILCDKIKIPFINLYEDGMPFNYYNSNVIESGEYVIFSTSEDEQGNPVYNVHPNDEGYKMISRFLAGKILSMFSK